MCLLPSLASTLSLASLALASHTPLGASPHLDLARRASSSSALQPRALKCPAIASEGPLMAAYVPAWTSGAVEAVDWSQLDVAFWFCASTVLSPSLSSDAWSPTDAHTLQARSQPRAASGWPRARRRRA